MLEPYLARVQPFMARALDVGLAVGTAREQDLIGLSVAFLAQACANLDTIARGEPSPYHTAGALHRVRRQMTLRLLDALGAIHRRDAPPARRPRHPVRQHPRIATRPAARGGTTRIRPPR